MDNRAGASGNIGLEAVVRSPADGYTLLLQNSTRAVNMGMGMKLSYDFDKDLTAIMLLGVTPIALIAHPNLNIKKMEHLRDYAKANPGKLSYGSCGIVTPMHFVMELTKQKTNPDIVHAGYTGCTPAMTDVVGGQVPLAILSANLGVSPRQGRQGQCRRHCQPEALFAVAKGNDDGREGRETG